MADEGFIASNPVSPDDDKVVHFRTIKSGVNGRLVRLSTSADTIITRHGAPLGVSEILGQALALVSMMGTAMKFDGKLILQTKTDGLLDFLVVDYQTPGSIRGYVRYDKARLSSAETSKSSRDPAKLFGNGYLAMTVDQGSDMDRYQGVVELQGTGLAEAAATYFRQSEQLPTYLKLAVAQHFTAADEQTPARWMWRACGLMLQYVASAGGKDLSKPTEENIEPDLAGDDDENWTRARLLAETIEDHELLDPELSADELLYRLFHEEGVTVFDRAPVTVYCRCSRDKVHAFLSSFGGEQLADMQTPDGGVSVTCEFCNTVYSFSIAEISS